MKRASAAGIFVLAASALFATGDALADAAYLETQLAHTKERLSTFRKELQGLAAAAAQGTARRGSAGTIEKLKAQIDVTEKHTRTLESLLARSGDFDTWNIIVNDLMAVSGAASAIDAVSELSTRLFGASDDEIYGENWQQIEAFNRRLVAEARRIRGEAEAVRKSIGELATRKDKAGVELLQRELEQKLAGLETRKQVVKENIRFLVPLYRAEKENLPASVIFHGELMGQYTEAVLKAVDRNKLIDWTINLVTGDLYGTVFDLIRPMAQAEIGKMLAARYGGSHLTRRMVADLVETYLFTSVAFGDAMKEKAAGMGVDKGGAKLVQMALEAEDGKARDQIARSLIDAFKTVYQGLDPTRPMAVQKSARDMAMEIFERRSAAITETMKSHFERFEKSAGVANALWGTFLRDAVQAYLQSDVFSDKIRQSNDLAKEWREYWNRELQRYSIQTQDEYVNEMWEKFKSGGAFAQGGRRAAQQAAEVKKRVADESAPRQSGGGPIVVPIDSALNVDARLAPYRSAFADGGCENRMRQISAGRSWVAAMQRVRGRGGDPREHIRSVFVDLADIPRQLDSEKAEAHRYFEKALIEGLKTFDAALAHAATTVHQLNDEHRRLVEAQDKELRAARDGAQARRIDESYGAKTSVLRARVRYYDAARARLGKARAEFERDVGGAAAQAIKTIDATAQACPGAIEPAVTEVAGWIGQVSDWCGRLDRSRFNLTYPATNLREALKSLEPPAYVEIPDLAADRRFVQARDFDEITSATGAIGMLSSAHRDRNGNFVLAPDDRSDLNAMPDLARLGAETKEGLEAAGKARIAIASKPWGGELATALWSGLARTADECTIEGLGTLHEQLQRLAQDWERWDRARPMYRRAIAQGHQRLMSDLEYFAELQRSFQEIRRLYAKWDNDWSIAKTFDRTTVWVNGTHRMASKAELQRHVSEIETRLRLPPGALLKRGNPALYGNLEKLIAATRLALTDPHQGRDLTAQQLERVLWQERQAASGAHPPEQQPPAGSAASTPPAGGSQSGLAAIKLEQIRARVQIVVARPQWDPTAEDLLDDAEQLLSESGSVPGAERNRLQATVADIRRMVTERKLRGDRSAASASQAPAPSAASVQAPGGAVGPAARPAPAPAPPGLAAGQPCSRPAGCMSPAETSAAVSSIIDPVIRGIEAMKAQAKRDPRMAASYAAHARMHADGVLHEVERLSPAAVPAARAKIDAALRGL